jgi:L-asparaginase
VSELHIGLVLTGGTVGSEYSHDNVVRIPQGRQKEWDAELQLVHHAWNKRGNLVVHPCQPLSVLSENMIPEHWVLIAADIRRVIRQHDVAGLLVLHGTDTACYTAAALSFLLSDVSVPIVITGSNLPPNQPDSDAVTNIRHALIALPRLPRGVYLSFAGGSQLESYIHLGTCVRKVKASGHAFKSINRKPIATVKGDDVKFVSEPPADVGRQYFGSTAVDPNVLAFRLYPGLNLDSLWSIVRASDIRGIVIELYASATGPSLPGKSSLPDFVRRCSEAEIPIFGCVAEAADQHVNLYDSSVEIAEAGAILLDDMLPETALVKLMCVLATTSDTEKIRLTMETPIAGERPRT